MPSTASISALLAQVWHQRPRLMTNPVILRELTVQLRKPASFIQLTAFLVIMTLYIIISWVSIHDTIQYENISRDQSRIIFVVLNFIASVVLLLFVPLQSATAINLERERDTWQQLASTPLSIASIIAGKLIASIFFIWILMFVLLPFYGVLFSLGGVGPSEIVLFFWLANEVILIVSLIGLICSALLKRPIASISSTYIGLLLYLLGIPVLAAVAMEALEFEWLADHIILISPIFLVMWEYAPGIIVSAPWLAQAPFFYHTLLNGLILVCLLLILFLVLRKREYSAVQWMQSKWPAKQAAHGAVAAVSAPKRYLVNSLIRERCNPMLHKELRSLFHWPYLNLIGSLAIPFALNVFLLWLVWMVAGPYVYLYLLLCSMLLLLSPLIILPYAAGSFRGERDRQTWRLLTTTTLPDSTLLFGKLSACLLLGGLRAGAFYLPALIIGLLQLTFGNHVGELFFIRMVLAVLIAVALMILYSTFALWVSVRGRKTIRAYVTVFVTAMLHYVGLPVGIVIITAQIWGFYHEQTMEFLQNINPIVLLNQSFDGGVQLKGGMIISWLIQMGWMLALASVFYRATLRHIRRFSDQDGD